MNNLDYTNQNTLSRYPFKDGADFAWTAGGLSGSFPNNLVTDAKVTWVGNTYALKLEQIDYQREAVAANDQWLFYFTNIIVAVNATSLESTVFSTKNSTLLLALEIDVAALSYYFRYEFVNSNTMVFSNPSSLVFCPSTFNLVSPIVDTITLNNTVVTDNTPVAETALVVTNSADPKKLDWKEGSNLQFSGTDRLVMNVIAGAGQGLYDACSAYDGFIRKINDIGANAFANFGITGDSCFRITPDNDPTTHTRGVKLDEICKPQCTEADLQAFAYYLNRVKSALLGLGDYIKQLKANYDQLTIQYSHIQDAQRQIRPAYLQVDSLTASNRRNDFHSLTCGIYSPTKYELDAELTVTKDAMFTLVPGSQYITQDGVKQTLADGTFGYLERVIKCNDVIYYGFVVSDTRLTENESLKNEGLQKYDVAFELTGPSIRAYYSIPLLYVTPNFTVAYTCIKKNEVWDIGISMELLHKETDFVNLQNGAKTGTPRATTLTLNAPPQMEFVEGSLVTDKSLIVPVTSSGFSDVHIDYCKKASCSLHYTCKSPEVSNLLNIGLSTALGFTSKSIPVKM